MNRALSNRRTFLVCLSLATVTLATFWPVVGNGPIWEKAPFFDGNRAVRLASQTCDLTRYANPNMLATLAAAYAETGQIRVAIGLAEQAQERAGTGQNLLTDRLAAMIESLAALPGELNAAYFTSIRMPLVKQRMLVTGPGPRTGRFVVTPTPVKVTGPYTSPGSRSIPLTVTVQWPKDLFTIA